MPYRGWALKVCVRGDGASLQHHFCWVYGFLKETTQNVKSSKRLTSLEHRHQSLWRGVCTWRASELWAFLFNVSFSSTDETTLFSQVFVILSLPFFHRCPENLLPPQVHDCPRWLRFGSYALWGLVFFSQHFLFCALVLNFSVLFTSFFFALRVSLVWGIFLVSPSPHSIKDKIVIAKCLQKLNKISSYVQM